MVICAKIQGFFFNQRSGLNLSLNFDLTCKSPFLAEEIEIMIIAAEDDLIPRKNRDLDKGTANRGLIKKRRMES